MIMSEMAEMWIFDLALKPHLKLFLVYLIKTESPFNNGLIYFDEIDSIMIILIILIILIIFNNNSINNILIPKTLK